MKPIIVSFPRSGRTWLGTMIGLIHCLENGIGFTEANVERKKLIDMTHDKTDKSLRLLPSQLPKGRFYDRRVVLLMRDPKDVMVSAWLHATKNKGIFDGTLNDYVTDERYGIVKWETFHRNWWDTRRTKYLKPVWYEHLVSETVMQLYDILLFCGIHFEREDSVKVIAHISTVEQLQEWEKHGMLRDGPKKPKGDDTEGFYHRRGEIGGWVDYMDQDLADYIDEVTKDNPWLNTKDMYSFAARGGLALPS